MIIRQSRNPRNPVFAKNRVSGPAYNPPLVILDELALLEMEIQRGMAKVRGMLQ